MSEKVKLGDICTIVTGSTPKTNIPEYWDGNIDWITPAELNEDSYFVGESNRKITEIAVRKTGLISFPKGTVIFSSRAPIGKVAIASKEMYCNQGFKNLICGSRIYNEYLYWYLKGNISYLKSLGRGATFKEISKKIIENVEMELPSLIEQKKIVCKLKKCHGIIQLRKKELQILDELVKARFIEMFGDPVKNEKGWPMVRLGELAEVKIGPFGSLLHREDYIEGGHALINPSHIVDGKIIIDSKLTISDAKYEELASYIMHIGDVVLGRRGEMGRCAVVDEEGYLCGTGSMILRSGKMMKPYFLQNIISSPSFRRIIEDKAVGVTMKNLNVPIVSELMIPKLPVNLQEQYLQLVEQSDKSKSVIQKSLDETQILFQSLMQEYFG